MPARILYVAYPLLTVSEESAGGAEQVLWTLEREMARRGVYTAVAASIGSGLSGQLVSTGDPCLQIDDFERRNREHQDHVIRLVRERALSGRSFDLIHDMSGSFFASAAGVDLPVLATLHLPRGFYPPGNFQSVPANVSFNCVSDSQARSFTDLKNMLGVVPNGIALDRFEQQVQARGKQGLLWLGRICEEKAPHLALEIAARAGLPITLAGQVYPFSYHQQYFEREVSPRLREMPNAVFVSSLSFEQKRKLLHEAAAVLITSQVAETSSLVAMEAAASGTPVIAFRRGALPEVVQDTVTGFIVDTVEEAAIACLSLASISPAVCLSRAQQSFSSPKMADRYAELYARVLSRASVSAAQV